MVRSVSMNVLNQQGSVIANPALAAVSSSPSTFRLADVMQLLVVQTLGAVQQWKRRNRHERLMTPRAGDTVEETFETVHQGMSVMLNMKARFGHQSMLIPERCMTWEIRFNAPNKKEKVIDGAQLLLEPHQVADANNPNELKGLDLIRTLIKAVYQSVAAEDNKRHQPWVGAIQDLYDKAMDGIVPYAVRDIPPSLLNPLAGGATLLEIGDGENRLEITSFTGLDDEHTRFKLTLRNTEGVHRLPTSVMNQPVIARCVNRLFAILTPPQPMVDVELLDEPEDIDVDND